MSERRERRESESDESESDERARGESETTLLGGQREPFENLEVFHRRAPVSLR